MHCSKKKLSSNCAKRKHQVYSGTGICWKKPFEAACYEKYNKWLGNVGIYDEIAAGNLKKLREEPFCAFLILVQNYPQRSSTNLSQAVR